jgi:hypothetical protein
LPTGTAVVPAVLGSNIFRPSEGKPLPISFKPFTDGHCTVRVFNLSGERVREPFSADVQGGNWIVTAWDGKNESSEGAGAGVYIVSIQGAGIKQLLKVVLLK